MILVVLKEQFGGIQTGIKEAIQTIDDREILRTIIIKLIQVCGLADVKRELNNM